MYEIYDTRTNDTVATVGFKPFRYDVTGDAPAVDDALEQADDLRQMNRTRSGESPAFKTPDGSNDPPTSQEGYQDPSDDFRLSRINAMIRPAYRLQEADMTPSQAARLAAASFSEGDKIETSDGERGIVVEIRTEPFEGPDGDDVDASDDAPAFIIATEGGAQAVTADEITSSDWSTDVDDPDGKLADEVAEGADASATAASIEATLDALPDDFDRFEHGTLEAGPTDWSYPDSWDESSTPNRLILLDAWSSMGGQFDCGGSCCKGTMLSSGMSEGAANRFCASMKDRVLMWEGWRS